MMTKIDFKWIFFNHSIGCDGCNQEKDGLNWAYTMRKTFESGSGEDKRLTEHDEVKIVLCQDCKKLMEDSEVKKPHEILS